MACAASPIACALDAHAETTEYDTPFAPSFVDTADDAALYIDVGMPSGGMRAVLGVEAAVVRVERLAAAETRADQDADALGVEPQLARLRRRFLGRDEREACEAVVAAMLGLMRSAGHLAGDAAVEQRRVDARDRADAAARVAQRVERGGASAAERRDDAEAGDDDAGHGAVAAGRQRCRSCRRTS